MGNVTIKLDDIIIHLYNTYLSCGALVPEKYISHFFSSTCYRYLVESEGNLTYLNHNDEVVDLVGGCISLHSFHCHHTYT